METRRRSRILLKAALGNSGHEGARGLHRRLELSDESETSDTPSVHHSEIVNSLKGIGTHYNHASIDMGWKISRKKAASQPRLMTINGKPQTLDTRRISTSSSSPIGKPSRNTISVPPHALHPDNVSRPPTAESLLSRASASTADHSEIRCTSDQDSIDYDDETPKFHPFVDDADGDESHLSPHMADSQQRSSSASELGGLTVGDIKRTNTNSAPFLSKLTKEDITRHNLLQAKRKGSFARPKTAPNWRNHSKEKVVTSSSTPKVKKKRHRVLSPSVPTLFDSSTDSPPSPHTQPVHETFLAMKPPKSKAPHHKKAGNQVHPMPHQLQPWKRESTGERSSQQSFKQESKTEELLLLHHSSKRVSTGTMNEEPLPRNQQSLREDSVNTAAGSQLHQEHLKRVSAETDEPLRVISTSPSTPSIGSKRSVSISESTRSSVSSMLTPLFTSSLRMRGSSSSSEARWELGGDSQLTSCFPDRNMCIFIVTWNMQEIKVGYIIMPQ